MKKLGLLTLLALLFTGSFLISFPVTNVEGADSSIRKPTGEFRIAMSSLRKEIFDPVHGSSDEKWYLTLLFDSLVGIDPPDNELSTRTGIAHKWEASPDYKVWTFHIREGIKFHNGDELTAEDVKFTLDRGLAADSRGTNKRIFESLIDKYEVVDKYTVRVHCKRPDSLLPLYFSEQTTGEAMIVPKKYIEEKGNDYFRANPIGTGPYKLKEHVTGSYMLFEAVDKHWAFGVPRYQYVRISVVTESLARIGLLKRKQVDMVDVPKDMVEKVQKLGFPIVEDPDQGVAHLLTHETWVKDYPISDIRVRKAINISIDRQAILDTLFGGLGEVAGNFIATHATIGYEPAIPPYPYDPDQARVLLTEAGYGPGNPCKITVASFTTASFPEAGPVVEVLASYWENVGFKVQIKKVPEAGAWTKKWRAFDTGGALSPQFVGGRANAIPVINYIGHSSTKAHVVAIPELDKQIDDALAELDPTKRAKKAHDLMQKMYDLYLNVPLILVSGTYGINPETIPDWKDWKMGSNMWDLNLEWVLFRK